MRTILLSFYFFLFFQNIIFAQKLDPEMLRDEAFLARDSHGGGAGNGGGLFAMEMARNLNVASYKYKKMSIRQFSSYYRVIVGNYQLCVDELSNCTYSILVRENQKGSPRFNVFVSKNSWNKSSQQDKKNEIERVVKEILDAIH